jgi:hypothetical protein
LLLIIAIGAFAAPILLFVVKYIPHYLRLLLMGGIR